MLMSNYDYDLNPVDQLVADAVGEPGKRTFFIQGRSGPTVVSLVLEKQEVANLATSLLQMLEDLEEMYPDLPPVGKRMEALYPAQPVEPSFRIRQLVLGYDEDADRVWLIAKALVADESGELVDPDDESVPSARMVATREQMRLMSKHALIVVEKGRPECPLCNRPIDHGGHFCPRTDGEAMPIVF